MQCRCCMFEVENGKASCPVCGFPTLGLITPQMHSVLSEYRTDKIQDISVGIMAYKYDIDPAGNVTEKGTEYVKLADADSLEYGEVLWLDKQFERIESNRSISIDICVSKGGSETVVNVEVTPDEAIDCGGVGLFLDSGFAVRLAVGNKDVFFLTEPVSLLNT